MLWQILSLTLGITLGVVASVMPVWVMPECLSNCLKTLPSYCGKLKYAVSFVQVYFSDLDVFKSEPTIFQIKNSSIYVTESMNRTGKVYTFLTIDENLLQDTAGSKITAILKEGSFLRSRNNGKDTIDITPPRGVPIHVTPNEIEASAISVHSFDGTVRSYTGDERIEWPPATCEILD